MFIILFQHIALAYRRRLSDAFLLLDHYSVYMKDPWPPQRVSAVAYFGTFDLVAAFAEGMTGVWVKKRYGWHGWITLQI